MSTKIKSEVSPENKRQRSFFTFFTKIRKEKRWFQIVTVEEEFRWGYNLLTVFPCRDEWRKVRFIN